MDSESLGQGSSTAMVAVSKAQSKASEDTQNDNRHLHLVTESFVLKEPPTPSSPDIDPNRAIRYRDRVKKLVHWAAIATTVLGVLIVLKALYLDF